MITFLLLYLGLLLLSWAISAADINQDESEVILNLFNSFSINCSADRSIVWKHDDQLIDSVLDFTDNKFTNILTLQNVTGENTGLYSCVYKSSHQHENVVKSTYIFVPDPSMVFLPIDENDEFIFVARKNKATIPCRVTNPNTMVTLHERNSDVDIPYNYNNKKGFIGHFDDGSYSCKASLDWTEVNTDLYYIYTVGGKR
ncbi:hypothetical protein PRIEUP_LOCUS57, partial [Pristimantis euphronides]